MTSPAPVLTLPPLFETVPGITRGYRLWTVDTLPLARAASLILDPNGPAMVTHRGWSWSVSITGDDPTATVCSFRTPYRPEGPEYHPISGTPFPTRDAATIAGWLAGITALMVYEDRAHRYGLPTA